MLINVDIGESENELEFQLLQNVDLVNIALGAHAGSPAWSRQLYRLAMKSGKQVALHPGYPDRDGFGRRDLRLPWPTLLDSLNQQHAVLPDVTRCKFHGAIYNQAVVDDAFAKRLATWCDDSGITQIVTPPHSSLALAASSRGISVLREGFVDRRYQFTKDRLTLASRDDAAAVIEEVDDAMTQANQIADHDRVRTIDGTTHPLQCDTLCFHGDSAHAIELSQRLRQWNELR